MLTFRNLTAVSPAELHGPPLREELACRFDISAAMWCRDRVEVIFDSFILSNAQNRNSKGLYGIKCLAVRQKYRVSGYFERDQM